ncbi:GNAT family N-acetyltransferase [Aureibacillus halotolerans]|uniref:Ribosomal protein S18 acetylase RimI-like enzyme n=1 Tax=Aureibacillus halotolerans TaxID=1508390 RepID=A0A4R6UDS7_9BACI|nr:GNAT family N-acetyltransferase [Aureibacillus halotolerans]TDQ42955.1 ribosomal protein S18 acetylase RimI-like enzyme [Aureibacillus halotolerans]
MDSRKLEEIKELQSNVEKHDNIRLKLNWDMLAKRKNTGEYDYFHYTGQKLTGFLGVYDFGSKLEICSMVDASSRRQGVATSLFSQALSDWGASKKEILYNYPEGSKSGEAFAKENGWVLAFTEYEMCCEISPGDEASVINVRDAQPTDEDMIYFLDTQGFEMSLEDAKGIYYIQEDPTNGTQLIEVAGEIVGKMRLDIGETETWIYGFVIMEKHRGKGYGRAALWQVTKEQLRTKKRVCLEVVATNAGALHLYESCGYTSFGAQHYYKSKNGSD